MNIENNIIGSLRKALKDGEVNTSLNDINITSGSKEYAYWRFLHRLKIQPEITIDHFVLLRQAIRWSPKNQILNVFEINNKFKDEFYDFDISYSSGTLSVKPYNPEWINSTNNSHMKFIDNPPVKCIPNEKIKAEGWLTSLGSNTDFEYWNSNAQREACFFALRAKKGSTNLIGLPTGSGKSLTFQLLTRFSSGLNLIIVPTTALAIDQWISSKSVLKKFPDINPKYYSSNDNSIDIKDINESLLNGTCRMLFTSPESCVLGSIKNTLDKLNQDGKLTNIFIDEAHIIQGWGGDFRVNFQLLSVIIKKWNKESNNTLRLFLLSATFTPRCVELLKILFSFNKWNEFSSQRLRPEMRYFSCGLSNLKSKRDNRLFKALPFLPRPLIIYVTKRDDAEFFYNELKINQGYKSIEYFHGGTLDNERKKILQNWRDNKIDIIVATSAFGMGVDKSDIRCVIHACFPESVDRFYQELGRGGRDGFNSISIIMPTIKEKTTAYNLLPSLLTEKKIKLRWERMIYENIFYEHNVITIPMTSEHNELKIGRTYDENILWNKRLILMMVRAQLLDIIEIIRKEEVSGSGIYIDYLKIKCNFNPHNTEDLLTKIKSPRSEELKYSEISVNNLNDYISGKVKICRVLKKEYKKIELYCTECNFCKNENFNISNVPKLEFKNFKKNTFSFIDIVQFDENYIIESNKKRFIRDIRTLISQKEIKTIVCSQNMFDYLEKDLEFFLKGRYFYRIILIDNLDNIITLSKEHILLIHEDIPNHTMLNFRDAYRISHFFPIGVNVMDNENRLLLHIDNSRYFTFKQWIEHIA